MVYDPVQEYVQQLDGSHWTGLPRVGEACQLLCDLPLPVRTWSGAGRCEGSLAGDIATVVPSSGLSWTREMMMVMMTMMMMMMMMMM
eukprot:3142500-Karenia_brevis.AAC.1